MRRYEREESKMTLDQIVNIQSVLDNRVIARDTYETLNDLYYFSKSKDKKIKLGDMHIDHFLRVIDKHKDNLNTQLRRYERGEK